MTWDVALILGIMLLSKRVDTSRTPRLDAPVMAGPGAQRGGGDPPLGFEARDPGSGIRCVVPRFVNTNDAVRLRTQIFTLANGLALKLRQFHTVRLSL